MTITDTLINEKESLLKRIRAIDELLSFYLNNPILNGSNTRTQDNKEGAPTEINGDSGGEYAKPTQFAAGGKFGEPINIADVPFHPTGGSTEKTVYIKKRHGDNIWNGIAD